MWFQFYTHTNKLEVELKAASIGLDLFSSQFSADANGTDPLPISWVQQEFLKLTISAYIKFIVYLPALSR